MPDYQDVLDVAKITVDTLEEIGIDECYFIGGVACRLYTRGQGRQPKDLDIVCLPSGMEDSEDIKRSLCNANNRFYTVNARNPRNPWTVLWFEWQNDNGRVEKLKVDILTPDIVELELPYVHPNYITKINKLPCAPLHLLLLHKLKAWDDRLYGRPHLRSKMPGDARDIRGLLQVANQRRLNITNDKPYITDDFRDASYERMTKFIQEHPDCEDDFIDLGMEFY